MARIIMCGSFKGGVGKTASSWNLAYSLAEMGKRVLAVDFDSQANLTTCFGIEDPAAVPVTIGHTFDGQIRIFKSIIPNTVKVGESIYYSEPLLEYAPENKACKAYRNLAEEVAGDES